MQDVHSHILRTNPLWPTWLPVFFAALFMSLMASPVQAGKALDRLDAFFGAKGALRTDFEQMVEGAAISQPKVSHGIFLMHRPGRFRWDYQAPYPQLILADGKRLWIYDEDLAQVVVKPLNAASLGDTPALLLSSEGLSSEGSGSDSLKQNFIITELDESRDGLYWVQLLPKATDSSFQEMSMGFGEKYISKMVLVDGFGQQTTLTFSNVEINANLPTDSFVFKPPKGVDVIGNPDD